jgi:hypothetical protein
VKNIINKLNSILHNMCYNNDTDDHDVINERTKRLSWRHSPWIAVARDNAGIEA